MVKMKKIQFVEINKNHFNKNKTTNLLYELVVLIVV